MAYRRRTARRSYSRRRSYSAVKRPMRRRSYGRSAGRRSGGTLRIVVHQQPATNPAAGVVTASGLAMPMMPTRARF